MIHQVKHVCQGKMYLSISTTTPSTIVRLLRKKYFTLNFKHLEHKACQILFTFTNQCDCLHLHSHCLHLPHTHSQHSHSLQCHSTINHHQSYSMYCLAIMIHMDYIILIFLCLQTTCIHEDDSLFSPQKVLVVLIILNTCVLDFCVVSAA